MQQKCDANMRAGICAKCDALTARDEFGGKKSQKKKKGCDPSLLGYYSFCKLINFYKLMKLMKLSYSCFISIFKSLLLFMNYS